MQVTIPQDAEAYVMGKAAAAGFADVTEYVITLIANDGERRKPAAINVALDDLQKLRGEVARMTREEIVQLVAEGRERCPQ